MAERGKQIQRWSYVERTLKNTALAEKGKIACVELSSGLIVPAAETTTGLLPIGYFDQTLTGNGTLKVRVLLFREVTVHLFANSGTSALADTDFGNLCYIGGDATVAKVATGRSQAGRCWGVTTAGVLVECLT